MFFGRRIWLWLYIRASTILGSKLNGPEQHGTMNCYQFNRFHCSFEEAENYCHAQGGHLAHTWNQEVQGLIWNFLEEGRKWWIGQNLMLLRKYQEKNNPNATDRWNTKPTSCTYMSRKSNRVSSKEGLCSLRHYFICQADQHASYERNGNNSHLRWRPKKTKREVAIPRNRMTSGATHLSTRCHQSAHTNHSKTLCHPVSPLPSVLPRVTQQGTSVPSVPTSQPLPVVVELTRSASVTHTGKALVESASNPREDSHPEVSTTYLQASLQNASDWVNMERGSHEWVIDEIAWNFSKAIHGLQTHNKLQKTCDVLQKLATFIPGISQSGQVDVVDVLLHLSKQLLKSPFENNSSPDFRIPVTFCLFHSLSNVVKAHDASGPRSKHVEQVGSILKMSLLALEEIQETFVQQNEFSESSVTLTSPVAILMLSSQNKSTLPLSSYTLGHPAPVRLGFPSASALEELLNKHPGVNVQVTGLAFNPFKDFDDKNIVGSIASVLVSSKHKLLRVHDLMEDIEVMLWRNASMETHPTTVNVSTEHFTVTVNITSLEKSLVLCIEPQSPVSVTLYLGFQRQPNHTSFHLSITLPKALVLQKDEAYTWVLTPESLQYGIGVYYVTAVLDMSEEGAQQAPTLFSVITALTQCYFWDSHNSSWKSSGCQVGPQSTVWRTQCLCNHLTYFGSDFFIVPRTVSVKDTARLFLRVTYNPAGVSLLASLLGFYVLLLMWAWRRDRTDMQKVVKVTVLADNDPSSRCPYLIQVSTGYRRRASTTAKVVITLYGSEGRSEPHHLCDSQKAVFERGGLDVFLLRTQSSLGELHSLRLWHDDSGSSPPWYVNQVIVSDIAGNKKWHFLCNCWLAVDLGDCEHDKVFIPASKKELFSFRHLFPSVMVEKFTQDYLWLSIATRQPWNQFSRAQRLTCCMTLLLCNMVVNMMFWKVASPAAERDEPVGPFAVTWSELLISIQTAAILLPINLVIGQLFPWIQPQEPLPLLPAIQAGCISDASFEPLSASEVVEELKETVGFLLRRNTYLLSECEQPSWSSYNVNQLAALLSSLTESHLAGQGCQQQAAPRWANVVPENHHHFCCYLLRVLQRLQSHVSLLGPTQADQSCDFLSAASQLQKLQELLETHTVPAEQASREATSSFPILSPEEGRSRVSPGLLRWLTYLCWLLLGVTSLAASFFTALYSLELNKDQATSWVISMILSALQNVFIIQPVKVVFLSLVLSLALNRLPCLQKEKEQQTKRILALSAKCSSSLPGSRDKGNPIYVAPAVNSPVKFPERTLEEKQLFKLAGDILVQVLFLILLLTAAHSGKSSSQFYLHEALRKSFSHHFSEIKLLQHFYPWASHILLPNLHGDYRGFITDGNSFLLGNVLLRQIRVLKPSHQDLEDTGNYGVNWGPLETNDTGTDSIWHYQSQEALGGSPIQGKFATYTGGGYVAKLGRNSSTAVRTLRHLEQSRWLDRCTRCLFVDFVVFNANVNLFCVVTLILESSNVGAFFTSVRLDTLTSLQTPKKDSAWSIISQVLYYLLVCYYGFIQGLRLKQQRWRFFTRKKNILDMSIILINFVILVLDMKLILLHKKNMAQYHYDRDRFINFYEAVKVNSAITHLTGLLVLLAAAQLWSLLHHNPQLQVIGRTLHKAWDEVAGFLLVILVLLTGYAIAFNLLFGWSISSYRTFFSSAVTFVGLLMGISNYNEIIALDPVLGSFLILSSIILMVLVIINLFVSVILLSFGKERKYLKTWKEATLIDRLLQKLSSLLGIQSPKTQVLDPSQKPLQSARGVIKQTHRCYLGGNTETETGSLFLQASTLPKEPKVYTDVQKPVLSPDPKAIPVGKDGPQGTKEHITAVVRVSSIKESSYMGTKI